MAESCKAKASKADETVAGREAKKAKFVRHMTIDADKETRKCLQNPRLQKPEEAKAQSFTAAHKVLFTAEYLVLIMKELAGSSKPLRRSASPVDQYHSTALVGMRTLLLAQRVCTYWRKTIVGSKLLQRLLFFEPARCEPVMLLDWHLDSAKSYKDKLRSSDDDQTEASTPVYGPEGQILVRRYPTHWGHHRDDHGRFRVFGNPLLIHAFDFLQPDGVYSGEVEALLPFAFQHPSASWKRMLITQPPIKTIVVMIEHRGTDRAIKDWALQISRAPGVDPANPSRPAAYTIGFGGWSLLRVFTYRPNERQWLEGMDLWHQWQGIESLRRVVKGENVMDESEEDSDEEDQQSRRNNSLRVRRNIAIL